MRGHQCRPNILLSLFCGPPEKVRLILGNPHNVGESPTQGRGGGSLLRLDSIYTHAQVLGFRVLGPSGSKQAKAPPRRWGGTSTKQEASVQDWVQALGPGSRFQGLPARL